jgi:hypothetical protein
MRTDRHDPNALIARWLDAERDGSEAADDMADAALLELFELLPPLSPPAGFADRVLLRIGETAPVAERAGLLSRLFRSGGFRLGVAFGVMATALSLLWLPDLLLVLGRLVTPGDLMGLGVASVIDLGRWLALAARIGEWLLTVGGALAVSLTSPAAVKVTAACLAVSGVSFVVLRDLMTRDRRWSYVDPIR